MADLESLDIFLGRKQDQLFVILKIQQHEEIDFIIKEIDQILKIYNFPPLFSENYVPHISLVSGTLKNNISEFKVLKTLKKKYSKEKTFHFFISNIYVKIGERITTLSLR